MPSAEPGLAFEAIGTAWRIETTEPVTEALAQAIRARIDRFDRDWSRFRQDSLVRRIAMRAGAHELGEDAPPLAEIYALLDRLSAGAVSPFVGAALERLGYGAGYRLRPEGEPAPAPRLGVEVVWQGRALRSAEPVLIDIGAAGKGYAVDLVAELLTDAGHQDWLVDAGGDLRAAGRPRRIGLEDPAAADRVLGVIELTDRALAASAVNRRRWPDGAGGELHHVLDARSGRPVGGVLASWAIADDARTADGIASALFFRSAIELALEVGGIECARLREDGMLEYSPGFEGAWFL